MLNIEETGSMREWGVGGWGDWSVGLAAVSTLIEFHNQPAITNAEAFKGQMNQNFDIRS